MVRLRVSVSKWGGMIIFLILLTLQTGIAVEVKRDMRKDTGIRFLDPFRLQMISVTIKADNNIMVLPAENLNDGKVLSSTSSNDPTNNSPKRFRNSEVRVPDMMKVRTPMIPVTN